jgi:pyridoxine 5-phosphate synthase
LVLKLKFFATLKVEKLPTTSLKTLKMSYARINIDLNLIAYLKKAQINADLDFTRIAKEIKKGGAEIVSVMLTPLKTPITEADITELRGMTDVPLNLEICATDELTKIAVATKPMIVTLISDGSTLKKKLSADLIEHAELYKSLVSELRINGIKVAILIKPDEEQVKAVASTGCEVVVLNTYEYSKTHGLDKELELSKIIACSRLAKERRLELHVDGELSHLNINHIAGIEAIDEIRAGGSVVSDAIFEGLESAVYKLREAVTKARSIEGGSAR